METSIVTSRRPLQAASTRHNGSSERRTGRSGWRAQLGRARPKATVLLALLQLVPLLLHAQAERIRGLFPARPAGYLTDVAGVVDAASARAIDDLAARLRTATGAELAVVTLPTIGDDAASDVAREIGRAWGVGGAAEAGDPTRNAGVVLLLVPLKNHQPGTGALRLETGRGVEGIITDAIAGRIADLMVPELRQENYGPALLLGTRAVAALIARGFGVSDSALTAADPFVGGGSGGGGVSPLVALLALIALVMFLNMLSRAARSGGGRRRRGPPIIWGGGGFGGGGWGGGSWGGGGGGFGGFGGGGGFSGGGAGRSF